MNIIGIIAEYNPFHNGHAYQIARIREKTNADYIVIAMSGDFMQRGTPAVIDKYARANMALPCGADLVLELPALFATASAESFAMAGVTLFEKMGCVNGICFGAETDDLPLLTEIAALLHKEPQTYRDALASCLKTGVSFPAARAKAVCDSFAADYSAEAIASVMNEPNNILAMEYLKAIQKRGGYLIPHLVKREGAGYHEAAPRTACCSCSSLCNAPTASATAIRNLLCNMSPSTMTNPNDKLTVLADTMPPSALTILTDYLSDAPALREDDFSAILGYLLLSHTKESLALIADSNEEIANRLWKNRYRFSSFSEFCNLNRNRSVTYTRINRVLMHLLLNITDSDYAHGKNVDYIPYLRILGFRRASAPLLSVLKKTAVVPVIAKLSDASDYLSNEALRVLEKDIFAADLYEQMLSQNTIKKTIPRSEYTREIVLV